MRRRARHAVGHGGGRGSGGSGAGGSAEGGADNVPGLRFRHDRQLGAPRNTLLPHDAGAPLWPAALGPGQSLDATGGVLLDANLMPVPFGTTPLDQQVTAVPPVLSAIAGRAAPGSRIVAASTEQRDLLPESPSIQAVASVHWPDTGSAPLAQATDNSVCCASRVVEGEAVFADRVLVFGGSIGLTTTVVWPNSGR